MGRIIRFLRSTAWISRIFFCVWLFLIIGTFYRGEDWTESVEWVIGWTAGFLIPAIIVEV